MAFRLTVVLLFANPSSSFCWMYVRAVLLPLLRTQHSIVVHKIFYRKTTEAEQGVKPKYFVMKGLQLLLAPLILQSVIFSISLKRYTLFAQKRFNTVACNRFFASKIPRSWGADRVADEHLDFETYESGSGSECFPSSCVNFSLVSFGCSYFRSWSNRKAYLHAVFQFADAMHQS